jgi:hypothetical protein
MARATSYAPSTIHRIWQAFGLQPHRQETFKLSSDPMLVEKVRDIIGLYLDLPDRALVLCLDEKSPIQALDRIQLLLPLRPGQAERRTHDYQRTLPPRCSLRSTSPPARSSASASSVTAPASSAGSSITSRPTCRPILRSIS